MKEKFCKKLFVFSGSVQAWVKPLSFSLVFITLLASCGSPALHYDPTELPNIVLIVADDIGLGDIGFYHRQRTGESPIVETPHLDQLIKEGMRFEDAHTSGSVCSPSRFGILTGNYTMRTPHPHGTWLSWKKPDIDTVKYETLATLTRNGGYTTAFFGKFGVGGQFQPEMDFNNRVFGPNQIGFDYSFELPSGIQGSPFAYYENNKWMPLRKNSQLVQLTKDQTLVEEPKLLFGDSNWDPSLSGKILSQKFNTYLHQYSSSSSSQPLFLYYASQAIHLPHAPADSIGNHPITGYIGIPKYDMIKELDEQVGNIIAQLKKYNIYDNTLIVFISDNGGLDKEKGEDDRHDSSNGYREYKGSVYEGGHRIPLIAVWNKHIPPDSKSDSLTSTLDLLPTISEIIGYSTNHPIDGKSIKATLFEEGVSSSTPHLVHVTNRDKIAIRVGDWKFIFDTNKKLNKLKIQEIYNLKENPSENEEYNYIDRQRGAEIEKLIKKAESVLKMELSKKI